MLASPHIQRVTLVLVAIATALVQVAFHERQPGGGLALLGFSLVVAIGIGVLGRSVTEPNYRSLAVGGCLLLGLLPIPWDLISRQLIGVGATYEVQLAYALRNLMLALAVATRLPRAISLAALSSLFLASFSTLWTFGPLTIGLLITYTIVGTWWLLVSYWDRLGGTFADSTESSIPMRPALATLVILGLTAIMLVPLVGRSPATTALSGFFPSSCGQQWSDPFAFGGVGDGDQMVAAKEQASSFGPVDSELFLESKMPSLYDAINEFSKDPPKLQKRMRRAIPLGLSQLQSNHKKKGLTQQATREFSTVRQTGKRHRDVEDRLSASLLLVSGRTPLHLALDTFDHWDGRSLIGATETDPMALDISKPDETGQRWLELGVSHPVEFFSGAGTSQVRVINLKTDRVPTPAGTTSVTMTGLHAANMFTFTADGSLAMDVDYVPQLTIFGFRSRLPDRNSPPCLQMASSDSSSGPIAQLAREWTRDLPAGWPQVEAIVARLRGDYTHDQEAMVPPEVEDAVQHFLFEAKRGPDYLFAASAAVMLRTLGYDTRVRSGFYVDPSKYVRGTRLTPVLAEDAHFWVEVRTHDGHQLSKSGDPTPGVWATVEPTPGYKVLYAPEPLFDRLVNAVISCLRWVASHPIAFAGTLIVVGLVVVTRRRLLDGALISLWSIGCRSSDTRRVAQLTLRLLELRAWAYRQSRPAGTPLGRWGVLKMHDDFVSLVGWALYGMGSSPPMPAEVARDVCRTAIRTPLIQQDAAPANTGAHPTLIRSKEPAWNL